MSFIKNVIIGIDGGSFEQISPLIRQKKLPNISRMISKGFFSILEVTVPPVTVPSWPCIFTGITMEDLGKCTFFDPSFGVFSSEFWKEKSIFSFKELKNFCLNVPSTFPAWAINGEMICGMLTPELTDKMVYPKSLFPKIGDDWIIDGENINQIFKAFNLKSKLFKSKLDEDFQLYSYVIRLPDCITHHPYMTISSTKRNIQHAYLKIDNFIGELLDREDIDNIFIISDHGLKIYNHEFNIIRFLEKNRFTFANNGLISKLTSLLIQIFNFINPRIVDTTFFHNKFKNLLQKSVANLNLNKLNLKNLRVVHFYSNYGGIYIPNRNRIIKNLIYKLLTRNKNVDKIYLFESSTLPDLIVRLNSKYIFSVKNSFLLKNYSNSFNHSDQGIMIAYGKNIKKDHFSSVSYIDLAPTFLSLYNINQPKDMKGKPLKILK